METYYTKYTDKYLELLEKFMYYMNVYNTKITLPNKANIVIFDPTDRDFFDYSLKILNRLVEKKEQNIIEVTKTGSKIQPWKISRPVISM